MHFASPGWLFLLVAVALVGIAYVLLQLRRRRFVARFSNAQLLATVVPRRPGWRRHLTFALLLIAMTVLSLGVARPTASVRVPQERATVMLAIDVSLSMQATDVSPTRLAAPPHAADAVIGQAILGNLQRLVRSPEAPPPAAVPASGPPEPASGAGWRMRCCVIRCCISRGRRSSFGRCWGSWCGWRGRAD